jgi:KaiC/GvpD/RAD55 family RecA-like ATPase
MFDKLIYPRIHTSVFYIYIYIVYRFDQVLDGGLYTGEVTEIAGEIAAGKTQVSNTLYRRSDRNSWRNSLW